jgi:tRNA threonylcarbamoyladenosine biosynthesis protein TsaB
VLLLALDTATAAVTVALHDGHRVLSARSALDSRRHAELLAPQVEQVLAEAGAARTDLTAICCGVGPGPFTSLRVGLVTARTLGFVLGLEVHGICSLDALAAGAARLGSVRPGTDFLVATDARRREVYSARYRWTTADGAAVPVRVGDPQVGPAAALAQDPSEGADAGPPPVVGRGAVLYPDALGEALPPLEADAGDLAAVAVLGLTGALPGVLLPPEPLYLRRPDAAEPGARKRVLPAARR